ncbi:lactoylglutathione lyase [Spirochaetia bacterium]|nr:lactoylglutathione lyase [Spirochaetia bacterium]
MAAQFTAGVQHFGLPTNNMKATLDFYKSLGFQIAYETVTDCQVCFLKLDNLMIETYENNKAVMKYGAIDHIALNATDIEAAYEFAKKGGYKILNDKIDSLPFWEKGCRFFTIEGPNLEKVEFCQIL